MFYLNNLFPGVDTLAGASLQHIKVTFATTTVSCDDTMELPFDSLENKYWLFFLIQVSSETNALAFGNIARKYFCLNQVLHSWCSRIETISNTLKGNPSILFLISVLKSYYDDFMFV